MSRLDDLSTGWLSLAVFAALYIIAAVIYVVVLALATGRRAQAFKAVSPGLLPPMGLLFALLVGFLVAQVWNDAERAELAVDREASALRSVDLLTASFQTCATRNPTRSAKSSPIGGKSPGDTALNACARRPVASANTTT